MRVIFRFIVIASIALVASGCMPLMAIGGASSLYGYHKDSLLDNRIAALEARTVKQPEQHAYAPYVPSIFQK